MVAIGALGFQKGSPMRLGACTGVGGRVVALPSFSRLTCAPPPPPLQSTAPITSGRCAG